MLSLISGAKRTMIKRIKIRNFQSHVDTEIVPSPGISVFVGRNMVGKSALLRALRLLSFNKPDGNDFVSWGATHSEVEIECNGHVVRRVKGKRINRYELDESIFSSFGKKIPQEIVDALGITSVRVDDRVYELTISSPHEPPFLVSETDAVKGKIFGHLGKQLIGDLVRLDAMISKANTTLKKIRAEEGVLYDECALLRLQLGHFEPLDDVAQKLAMCHDLLSKARQAEALLEKLGSCQYAFVEMAKDSDVFNKYLGAYDFTDVDSKMVTAESVQFEIERITSLRTTLHGTNFTLGRLSRVKSALETIPDVEEAQLLSDELESRRSIAAELRTLKNSIRQANRERATADFKLNKVLGEYREVLLTEQRCPICFGPVDDHSIEKILKELANEPSTIGTAHKGYNR